MARFEHRDAPFASWRPRHEAHEHDLDAAPQQRVRHVREMRLVAIELARLTHIWSEFERRKGRRIGRKIIQARRRIIRTHCRHARRLQSKFATAALLQALENESLKGIVLKSQAVTTCIAAAQGRVCAARGRGARHDARAPVDAHIIVLPRAHRKRRREHQSNSNAIASNYNTITLPRVQFDP